MSKPENTTGEQSGFSVKAKSPEFHSTVSAGSLDRKSRRSLKWLCSALKVLMFGLLSLLILHWQSTGQMLPSAAQPSVYVCAMLMGVHLRASCESFKKR